MDLSFFSSDSWVIQGYQVVRRQKASFACRDGLIFEWKGKRRATLYSEEKPQRAREGPPSRRFLDRRTVPSDGRGERRDGRSPNRHGVGFLFRQAWHGACDYPLTSAKRKLVNRATQEQSTTELESEVAMSFPNGTLLEVTSDKARYLMIDSHVCLLNPETEAKLFTPAALRNFKPITQQELDGLTPGFPFPDNTTLIKGQGRTEVYLFLRRLRCWIISPQVFESYGFDWSKIQVIPVPDLDMIPPGPDVT
jgi:hypothetical protein